MEDTPKRQLLAETQTATVSEDDHACVCTHGMVVEHLISLVPAPASDKAQGDPFITLSPRAAKAWLALFSHARTHGTWQTRPTDPSRPELAQGQEHILGHGGRWRAWGMPWAAIGIRQARHCRNWLREAGFDGKTHEVEVSLAALTMPSALLPV